jgi:ThiF family
MNTLLSDRQAAYYARIVPVLGAGLRHARIAVCGVAAVTGAVERLAGCRAVRWWIADDTVLAPAHPLVRGGGAAAGTPAGPALAAWLQAHNAWETGWEFRHYPALTPATLAPLAAAWRREPPDLLLGGGDAATLATLAALARDLAVPALLVAHYAAADPSAACLALLPGDGGHGRDWPDLCAALGAPPLADPAALPATPAAWHAWTEANSLAALLARALLLPGSPHTAPALDRIFWRERRTAAVLGTAAWPWTVQYADLAVAGQRQVVSGDEPSAVSCQPSGIAAHATPTNTQDSYSALSNVPTAPLREQHSALVVGCGSLGSLVARGLVASGAVGRLALVDGETVDAANPVRQFFHTDQVGQPKAAALAHTVQVGDDRAGLAAFRRLLRTERPDVVVLATGSHADYALARVLRRLGIPHIVGRCYPRARYFEIIVVDGRRGPCFGCLRGHLYTGPAPAPTPEEALRYDRPAPPGELQSEPATVVESGRAADVMARLAAALARPRRERAPWLLDLLTSEQTCLIGGLTVEAVPGPAGDLAWAYGVQVPGQVVAFGVAQVVGTGAVQVCPDCGRRLSVAYPLVDAPAASERSPHTPAALTTHRTHREQLVRLYP